MCYGQSMLAKWTKIETKQAYAYNQKDSVEIVGSHNEEIVHGKFNTHKTYSIQAEQKKLT